MNIITVSPLLYIIINIIAFNTNNITVLLLFIPRTDRADVVNIINITIEKFNISKIMILLSVYVDIIIP